jgi:transcriptional regulator of acetoin/glycerol metabolism
MAKAWPGNVRELAHLLEAALILSEQGRVEVDNLEEAAAMKDAEDESEVRKGGAERQECLGRSRGCHGGSQDCRGKSGRYAFFGSEEEEREVIRRALAGTRGNKTLAARQLGMARNTLRVKLRRYGLD